jgi:hypothetical protein
VIAERKIKDPRGGHMGMIAIPKRGFFGNQIRSCLPPHLNNKTASIFPHKAHNLNGRNPKIP